MFQTNKNWENFSVEEIVIDLLVIQRQMISDGSSQIGKNKEEINVSKSKSILCLDNNDNAFFEFKNIEVKIHDNRRIKWVGK